MKYGIFDVPGTSTSKSSKCWRAILERCHCERKQKSSPTYVDCTACDEWHTFSNFKHWYDKHHIPGTTIDKDICHPGNKHYSPEKCMFVSKWLNNLFKEKPPSTRISRNKNLYVGVDLHFGKYRAQMNNIPLGRFETPEQARICYLEHKSKWVQDLIGKIRSDSKNPKWICSEPWKLFIGLHHHRNEYIQEARKLKLELKP